MDLLVSQALKYSSAQNTVFNCVKKKEIPWTMLYYSSFIGVLLKANLLLRPFFCLLWALLKLVVNLEFPQTRSALPFVLLLSSVFLPLSSQYY